MRILYFCLFFAGFAATSQAALTYNNEISYDDGMADNSIGGITPTDQVIWLNAFRAGQETVVFGINVALGPNPGNGAPMQVYLWSDPNNDGDPSDAVLEETLSANYFDSNYVSGVPLTFTEYLLTTPRTYFGGEYYFLGFQSAGFALVDSDSSVSRSFIYSDFTSNLTDPNNLSDAVAGGNMGVVAGTPGALTIRALVEVPEPSTYLAIITALGLIGLVAYRRRQSRLTEAE